MTLVEYRAILGWSQAELARQAGIAAQTVGKAESGEPIAARSANLICKALSRGMNRTITLPDVRGWNVVV